MRNMPKERIREIVKLYESGKSLEEILQKVGWREKSLGVLTKVLREWGYKLPYAKNLGEYYEIIRKMSQYELERLNH